MTGPKYQDLSLFAVEKGFRGRSAVVVTLWQLTQATLFAWSPHASYAWRRALLRLFGAKIGKSVVVRSTARITYPWRVDIGDYSWIGDDVVLYSFAQISIGSNSVISQKSYVCAGSHDLNWIDFPLTSSRIAIGDETWIASDCFLAPGVTIGYGAVVAARSTVLADIPPEVIAAGAPATVRRKRTEPFRGAK